MKMTASMLMRDLEKGRPVKVSSDFSFFGAFIGLIIVLLYSFILFAIMKDPSTEFNKLALPLIFYFIILGLTIYQFIFVSKVFLVGNKLLIKKIFRKKETVLLNQIQNISTFRLKNTKYTIVSYKLDNGLESKALILNSNSVLFGKQETLEDLLEYAKVKQK
ncbi:hypothetical protein [Tenuifilum thalassicum]|uniref:Uncharacterized protein n=1 Tax=Tenuifilum thalassicum TaxID=2590900 RepID=A0A7D4CFA9_9BACT|nr:hypothetical protein [Tenuifilum thalassicum]QKG78886.1 hypothetical protein FHG85_00915 [Tenuifilum thalassicum]